MPGLYSSHGTTVSFGGTSIGFLTGFDVDSGGSQLAEVTSADSAVVGTGSGSRVVREFDCTAIELPTISITFIGPPSFSSTDAGTRAQLVFDAPGKSLSGEAILTKWNHAGRSNQYSTGSATFQFTGVTE